MKLKLSLVACGLVALLVVVVQVSPPTTQAQSGGSCDLSWNVIAGGSGSGTGGTYKPAARLGA